MEQSEIEEKIKVYENSGWNIIKVERGASEYQLDAPSGMIFDSEYLSDNICQLCYDGLNEDLLDDEDVPEIDEEDSFCDGSLHSEQTNKEIKEAKELYSLIYSSFSLQILRLLKNPMIRNSLLKTGKKIMMFGIGILLQNHSWN